MAPTSQPSAAAAAAAAASHTTRRGKATRFRFKAPHRTPRPFSTAAKAQEQAQTQGQAQAQAPSTDSNEERIPPASKSAPNESNNPHEEVPFAEALFDALSSAESAAYWASVYGQPIHIYARPLKSTPGSSVTAPVPVSDEEYMAYVQARLWAKTTEGLQARARERAQARAQELDDRQRERDRAERARRRASRAARCAERKERDILEEREDGVWEERCAAYGSAWLHGDGTGIPWPVFSGDDDGDDGGDGGSLGERGGEAGEVEVSEHNIEMFFRHLARARGLPFAAVIKAERVRWHPDKIVQRFGIGIGLAGETEQDRRVMRRVNEVWRAIDAVWRRVRETG